MSEAVKVAVRCRPMSQRELQQQCRNIATIDPASKTCTLENGVNAGTAKVYQFDAAFGPEISTEVVYEQVGSVVVEALLEGYNGTVFAYGQTGCGKSFTMHGFIEKSLEHLFEATSTSSSETRYLALLSYLEIYNEKLRDLLQESSVENLLQLKEDPNKGTYVAGGLREITVKNANECSRLVEEGNRRRIAAATKMNAESSRSHAVLTLALEAIAINEDDKRGNTVRKGRLHLVDLAGSERQGRTGATGERLKEAASINLSLSALGNVISALAAGNGRHVPYRDSKLTRLLRDSLGGNARTLMIACISPCSLDGDETLSTLRYAARARYIKNKPIVNEDPKDALLRQYQIELEQLRKLIETSEQPRELSSVDEGGSMRMDEEEIERLRKECEDSNSSSQKLREELLALRSKYLNGGGIEEKKFREEDLDPERAEKRRKKREAAKQEVLRRLEKLTIGGEARQNEEVKKRRERRRKRLAALAEALERSVEEGNVGAFEVYGQLKSTEDALKKMARRTRQLEAEAADLQASWDAERRELLRRELLATQLCDAMLPHLRPGCPFRDLTTVRDAATWCEELNRWRLPDVSESGRIPSLTINGLLAKSDLNNNKNRNEENEELGIREEPEESNPRDIADMYFRRKRINDLLAHVREAKTFDSGRRISKSGGSGDPITGESTKSFQQLNALNLQSSAAARNNFDANIYRPPRQLGGWIAEDDASKFGGQRRNVRLEALPPFPLNNNRELLVSQLSQNEDEEIYTPDHQLVDTR